MTRGLLAGDDVLALLPQVLREGEVASALATVIARVLNVPRAQRQQLGTLVSAEDCPAAFLEDLAWSLGFTDDLRAFHRVATAEDWRRVVRLAAPLWRAKGLHESLRTVIALFTGARCWIGDWFSFRTVVGVSLLPWFATVPVALGGDALTDVHVEDLDGASLDRAAVMDALDLVRPGGETIRAVFVPFVENWTGLDRWTHSAGATLGDFTLELGAGDYAIEAYANGLGYTAAATWLHSTHQAIVRLAVGAQVRLGARFTIGYFEVRVTQGVPGAVSLVRSGAVLVTVTPNIPDGSGAWVLVGLRISPLGPGTVQLDAVIDGNVVATAVAATLAAGAAYLSAVAGAVSVEWFEVLPSTPEIRSIPA